jgi:hypothetical protein
MNINIGDTFYVDDIRIDDYSRYDGSLTVAGYTYYLPDCTHYTCLTEDGRTVDVHEEDVRDYMDGLPDDD